MKSKKIREEKAPWFDGSRALKDFYSISNLYDYIMGYYEIRSNKKAIGLLNFFEGCEVLDIGVGTGLSLKEILKNLPKNSLLVGLDYCEAMLIRSKKRIDSYKKDNSVILIQSQADETKLENGSFDIIYSSFLLDLLSIEKRNSVLNEMKRLLKPDGVICICVMDIDVKNNFDNFLNDIYNFGYGRWNKIWQFFFKGYAPHCRPIRIMDNIKTENFEIINKQSSYVLVFPVSIYLVKPRKQP